MAFSNSASESRCNGGQRRWSKSCTRATGRWQFGYRPFKFVVVFGPEANKLILSELKVTLARILQRVELELLSPDAVPAGTAGLRPKSGVPVRVLARN